MFRRETKTFWLTDPRRFPCAQHKGFTLIESLVALSIGSALIAVAGLITIQTAQLSKAAQQRIDHVWKWNAVLQQFEDDVQNIVSSIPAKDQIVLSSASDELARFVTLATVPDSSCAFRRRMPALVVYRLASAPGTGGRVALVREVTDLTAPEAPAMKRVIASPVRDVRIELYCGDSWVLNSSECLTIGDRTNTKKALRLSFASPADLPAAAVRTVIMPVAGIGS